MSDLKKIKDLVEKDHFIVRSVKSTSKGTILISLIPGGCSCGHHHAHEPIMMVTTDEVVRDYARSRMQA